MAKSIISHAKRLEIEKFIYKAYDAVDKSGRNSEFYKNKFKNMSDDAFYVFISSRLPFRVHISLFDVEPEMKDYFNAFKVLNKPLMEQITLPYLYKDKDGKPIRTQECLVGYINIKRMKQILTKKNNTAIEISKRDMRTGLLMNEDKGGKTSDREFESLVAMGLEYSIDEFSTVKADAMKAKAEAYNKINTDGQVSFKDIDIDKSDSLGRNLIYWYMIGANIKTNLVGEDYYTPYTLSMRQKKVEREV